jgi:hypothetical protein
LGQLEPFALVLVVVPLGQHPYWVPAHPPIIGEAQLEPEESALGIVLLGQQP